MSDLFPLFDDDDADGGDGGGGGGGTYSDGRRSLWTVLTVLAFALVVVVVAAFLLRSSPSRRPNPQLAGPSEPGTATATFSATDTASASATPSALESEHPTSPHPSTSARRSAPASKSKSPSPTPSKSTSTSKRATPTPTPTPSTSTVTISYYPCTSPAPCVVGGDAGAIAEVQLLRHDSVPGYVTGAAQACALLIAEGGNCAEPGSYGSFPESTQDGRQAAKNIWDAANSQWLKAKPSVEFQVGWAFNPGRAQFTCVLLEGSPTT